MEITKDTNKKIDKIFICFTNNKGVGGLLAGKIYATLTTFLPKDDVFFSSSSHRVYGDDYRKAELQALHEAMFFILVLTDELVDKMNEESETLFEIKTAFDLSKKIIPVAINGFSWNNKRVEKIADLLGDERALALSKIDYIPFFGEREYESLTALALLKAVGITPKNTPFQSIAEVRNQLIKIQSDRLFVDDNNSTLGNELLFFQQNLFLEPNKKVNGKLVEDSILPDISNCAMNQRGTWFLLGEIGSGKTTQLRKLYSSLADEGSEILLPVFIRANEVKSLSFEKETLLKTHLQNLGIFISATVFEQLLQNAKLCFFVDAIDEILGEDYSAISRALNERSQDCAYIFSCRKNIFQYLEVNKVDYIVEILKLTDSQKLKIIDDCFKLENIQNDSFKKIVKDSVLNNEIFNNILFVAIWLLFLKNQSINNFYLPLNKFEMMSRIMNWLIFREKKKGLLPEGKDFSAIMNHVAFIFLKNKSFGGNIQFNELAFGLSDVLDFEISREQIKLFISVDPITDECTFAHEQFYEFLIAKFFVELLKQKKQDTLIELLSYSFSIETNQFITEQFLSSGSFGYFLRLKELYDKTQAENYRARLNILNHMHRTSQYAEIEAFVSDELKNKGDSLSDLDSIILLHSLVVAGGEEEEELYFNRLQNDPNFEKLNASITLSYYFKTTPGEPLPACDDVSKSWYPVFVGYRKHIEKSDRVLHYKKVLRINMFTAKTFINARKQVDPVIAEFYLSLEEKFKTPQTSFEEKILKEYLALLEVIKKYAEGGTNEHQS